jgi:hypothetical protein
MSQVSGRSKLPASPHTGTHSASPDCAGPPPVGLWGVHPTRFSSGQKAGGPKFCRKRTWAPTRRERS